MTANFLADLLVIKLKRNALAIINTFEKGGEYMMVSIVKLPFFEGYTFDFRLKEIRRPYSQERGSDWEFLNFDSPKGDLLLAGFFTSIEGKKEFVRYWNECVDGGYSIDHLILYLKVLNDEAKELKM